MIELGQKARDTVTGFVGTVIARSEYLHGCIRLALQPGVDKDGKVPDAYWIDEPQAELVDGQAIPVGSRTTGGPMPVTPRRNADPTR